MNNKFEDLKHTVKGNACFVRNKLDQDKILVSQAVFTHINNLNERFIALISAPISFLIVDYFFNIDFNRLTTLVPFCILFTCFLYSLMKFSIVSFKLNQEIDNFFLLFFKNFKKQESVVLNNFISRKFKVCYDKIKTFDCSQEEQEKLDEIIKEEENQSRNMVKEYYYSGFNIPSFCIKKY